jgi:hypothetical protein
MFSLRRFRNALKLAGAHFIHVLSDCVSPELSEWREKFGLEASLSARNIAVDGRVSIDGHVISRSASSSVLPTETSEQRLARL